MRLVAKFFVSMLILGSFCVSFQALASLNYNKIVFFGDSLSDNGNLYSTDFGFMPKSPPYFEGRFSNGYVWSEYVAKYFYDKNYTSSVNFAVGGETAIWHDPLNGYLPYCLTFSLKSYLARTILSDRSHTLFVFWIGANDYLPKGDQAIKPMSKGEIEQLTNDVVASIRSAIETLINDGGKNFLVIGLPDLSETPYAKTNHTEKDLKELSLIHNAKLNDAVLELQQAYKSINIHLYDLNKTFGDFLSNPAAFNEKYHVNVTDTTTACWQGGYMRNANKDNTLLNDQPVSEQQIAADMQNYLHAQARSNYKTKDVANINKIDVEGFSHFVANTPALAEAYKTTKKAEAGVTPCSNPNERIFWDHVHPTAVVHRVLAEEMLAFINQYYPQ